MNTKQFLEKLYKDALPLVCCFCIALITYLFHQYSSLDRKSFTISVNVQNDGMMIPSSELGRKRFVRVSVRGDREQIAALTENDFSASINLNNQVNEGTFDIPIILNLSDRAILMEPIEINIKPEKISVTLEEKTVGAVKVSPSIVGSPAYGYEQGNISVEPQVVTVVGPKSMVNKLEAISTSAMSIEGTSQNQSKTVNLVNTNSLVNILNETSPVVNVEIKPQVQKTTFQSIPITYQNLFDDIEVTSQNSFVNVEVEGNLLTIEKISSSQISAFVDCSFVNDAGDWELEVNVRIPSSLTLVSKEPSKIIISTKKHVYDETDVNESSDSASSDEKNLS